MNNLRRYLLLLQYDGAPYQGWQLQRARPTVQEELERVLQTITGEHRAVTGSGRTDAGVHALGQAAAVDVPVVWSAGELRRSMNALLPPKVWLREVRRVPDDFHPRFHPTARAYEYQLGVTPGGRLPVPIPLVLGCLESNHRSRAPARGRPDDTGPPFLPKIRQGGASRSAARSVR